MRKSASPGSTAEGAITLALQEKKTRWKVEVGLDADSAGILSSKEKGRMISYCEGRSHETGTLALFDAQRNLTIYLGAEPRNGGGRLEVRGPRGAGFLIPGVARIMRGIRPHGSPASHTSRGFPSGQSRLSFWGPPASPAWPPIKNPIRDPDPGNWSKNHG